MGRAAAVILVLIFGCVAWVAIPAWKHLSRARAVLDRPFDEVGRAELSDALDELRGARASLTSVPATFLRAVPFVSPNLGAARVAVEHLERSVQATARLQGRLEDEREAGILSNHRVDIAALESLSEPAADTAAELRSLARAAAASRNGWLAPPLWNTLSELARRAGTAADAAGDASEVLKLSPAILGRNGARTYAVLLVNNAELRGAGGVLTGVGTVRFDDGRIRLGRFVSVHDLQRGPSQSVPAPQDFAKRYAQYDANTTLWINASFSPDVPETSVVAARLLQKTTGIRTEGAILVDPRGLAALVDPDTPLRVPGLSSGITAAQLPDFVFSDAYEMFRSQDQRRAAILGAGAATFKALLDQELTEDRIASIGEAVAGGHLRLNLFDPIEEEVISRTALSGRLFTDASDSLLVVVQNFGGGAPGRGTKLDYWVDRIVHHTCRIEPAEPTPCGTEVTLQNRTPKNLTPYVAGSPYGLVRSMVEIYVPAEAHVSRVDLNDAPVGFRTSEEDGRRTVEVYVEIARRRQARIDVAYELPAAGNAFSLKLDPQPLARDAELHLQLGLPDGWSASEPEEDGVVSIDGPWDRTIEITAERDRRTGMPALIRSLREFWENRIG